MVYITLEAKLFLGNPMSSADDALFEPIRRKQEKSEDTELAKEFRRIIETIKEKHKVENFEEDKC